MHLHESSLLTKIDKAWAAHMEPVWLVALDIPVDPRRDELTGCLRIRETQPIQVDRTISSTNSRLESLLDPQLGTRLERVFVHDQGNTPSQAIEPGPKSAVLKGLLCSR
jgi:hypothetical protein